MHRKLVHDRKQFLLDELGDIVFHRNVDSSFMPELSDTPLQWKQNSLHSFFEWYDRDRAVEFHLKADPCEGI